MRSLEATRRGFIAEISYLLCSYVRYEYKIQSLDHREDMDQREQLIDIFVRYNAQINLSAIRDPHDIRIKHIQDSLELLKIVTLKP